MEKLFKQDGEISREYTEDEYAQHLKDQAENELAMQAKLAQEEKAFAEREALLAKLGITIDEAALLLG